MASLAGELSGRARRASPSPTWDMRHAVEPRFPRGPPPEECALGSGGRDTRWNRGSPADPLLRSARSVLGADTRWNRGSPADPLLKSARSVLGAATRGGTEVPPRTPS